MYLFHGMSGKNLKTIRNKLNKHDGDMIHVVIEVEE